MTIHRETIAAGGAPRCDDCGLMPRLDVYESSAGFYVGTFCGCGPYSRESGYYPTLEAARAAFGRGYSR